MQLISIPLASFGIFSSPAPKAIFVLCITVSSCILLYYAKRHPLPKFRPKLGELVLVGMIFFGISIAITMMTSSLFEQENLDAEGKKAKVEKRRMRSTGGTSDESDGGGSGKSEDIFEDELPPFIPEEE